MFNTLPFDVYFAGVYFGKGSVYTSVFMRHTHIWRCLLCRDLTFLPTHTPHTSQLGQVGGPLAPRSPPASPQPSLGQLGQSTFMLESVFSQRVAEASQSVVPTTLHARGQLLCPSHLRHLNPSSAEAPLSSPGPRSPSHGGCRSSPSWWSCTSTDPTTILLQPHSEVLDRQANGVSMPSLWGLSYFFRDVAHQVAPSLT